MFPDEKATWAGEEEDVREIDSLFNWFFGEVGEQIGIDPGLLLVESITFSDHSTELWMQAALREWHERN